LNGWSGPALSVPVNASPASVNPTVAKALNPRFARPAKLLFFFILLIHTNSRNEILQENFAFFFAPGFEAWQELDMQTKPGEWKS
jgi:hypothetical protein